MTRWVIVGLLTGLTGCASLGYQSTSIKFDRNAWSVAWGQAMREAGYVEGYAVAVCEREEVSTKVCQDARSVRDRMVEYINQVEERMLSTEEGVDVRALAQLGSLAGSALRLLLVP